MHLLDRELLYLKVNPSILVIDLNQNILLILATITHQLNGNKRLADSFLFKYVLEHASTYNIQIRRRPSVGISSHSSSHLRIYL